MIVSIGEFHIKKLTLLPEFIKISKLIYEEAKKSKGNQYTEIKNKGMKTFYSFTVWDSMENMRTFVHTNTHKEALKLSEKFAKEFTICHYEASKIPSIEKAIEYLTNTPNKETYVF